jgi:DNA (cytosine-5)-methyltransferase 1
MGKITVLDLFCGAGGFSEGFRQQGFDIVLGIDNWQPATDTFNHNFNLTCSVRNILDFENSDEEIEKLPDTDVIIGSPPCVSFSHSNNSGKADKESGIKLTKIFLRIVSVKKHKRNSLLKAWYMENVANSKNYLNEYYTFKDLDLKDWAKKNGLSPNDKAIILKDNQHIICSADYGSPQKRKRIFSGELIHLGCFPIPPSTHIESSDKNKDCYRDLKFIKSKFPSPFESKSHRIIQDPMYKDIRLTASELTDHFYDTGLYESEWKQSRHLKINHPYMGKMSFPENEDRPSRTITATKIGTSREAIIYHSEYERKGNGEYRIPTVREAASIMGFPITFQFKGSEGIKWKLVGNAVCPTISSAFAKKLRFELGLEPLNIPFVEKNSKLEGIPDLNTYAIKLFDNPPKRVYKSRFRRHPFKDGNITVTLSNYNIARNTRNIKRWITSVQYGNGEGFPTYTFPDHFYIKLEHLIESFKKGEEFLYVMKNGFSEKIGSRKQLQEMFELQHSMKNLLEPTNLVEEVARIINSLEIEREYFYQNEFEIFKNKDFVPVKQLFALYAINKISSNANNTLNYE